MRLPTSLLFTTLVTLGSVVTATPVPQNPFSGGALLDPCRSFVEGPIIPPPIFSLSVKQNIFRSFNVSLRYSSVSDSYTPYITLSSYAAPFWIGEHDMMQVARNPFFSNLQPSPNQVGLSTWFFYEYGQHIPFSAHKACDRDSGQYIALRAAGQGMLFWLTSKKRGSIKSKRWKEGGKKKEEKGEKKPCIISH